MRADPEADHRTGEDLGPMPLDAPVTTAVGPVRAVAGSFLAACRASLGARCLPNALQNLGDCGFDPVRTGHNPRPRTTPGGARMSGGPERVGVLDVGCFSAQLVVVDRARGSLLHPEVSHKVRLRMDRALDGRGRITKAGVDE